jgi:hypothetical protein
MSIFCVIPPLKILKNIIRLPKDQNHKNRTARTDTFCISWSLSVLHAYIETTVLEKDPPYPYLPSQFLSLPFHPLLPAPPPPPTHTHLHSKPVYTRYTVWSENIDQKMIKDKSFSKNRTALINQTTYMYMFHPKLHVFLAANTDQKIIKNKSFSKNRAALINQTTHMYMFHP